MSVRKGDRDESDFKVVDASKELLSYTYDRVRDKDIFPKSEKWLLAKNVWDDAVGARSCIVRANAINVETEAEAKDRLELEKLAIGYLDTLETLLDLANVKGLISDKRMEYWEGLVDKTLKPLKGWLKSDRQRYKKIVGKSL